MLDAGADGDRAADVDINTNQTIRKQEGRRRILQRGNNQFKSIVLPEWTQAQESLDDLDAFLLREVTPSPPAAEASMVNTSKSLKGSKCITEGNTCGLMTEVELVAITSSFELMVSLDDIQHALLDEAANDRRLSDTLTPLLDHTQPPLDGVTCKSNVRGSSTGTGRSNLLHRRQDTPPPPPVSHAAASRTATQQKPQSSTPSAASAALEQMRFHQSRQFSIAVNRM
jgi:hypothetical protein